MSSGKPIAKKFSRNVLLTHGAVVLIIFEFYQVRGVENALIYSYLTYFVLQIMTKFIIPHNHRKGISYLKKNQYKEALEEFEKSYEYFYSNKWIDKYRSIVILSRSKITYREMALLNMAYCYGLLGEGTKSKITYEKALEEFPGSEIAISSLQMFESAKDIK